MWLHVDPKNVEAGFSPMGSNHAEEPMLGAATADDEHVQSLLLCNGNMPKLQSLGQVEISDEATLEDLKTLVDLSVLFESACLWIKDLYY